MSNTRRSRYTVVFEDGYKMVYRLYTWDLNDPLWFEKRHPEHGRVIRFDKGDYRQQEQKQETLASDGFIFDQKAIDEAIDLLGIKWPVKLRTHARYGNTYGNHIVKRKEKTSLYHDIMIKSYLAFDEASGTLWHELTHAMQAERDGGSWTGYIAFKNRMQTYSYDIRPSEVEARDMEDMMKDHLLCKPKSSKPI